ncbi:FRG domain-containing protein [Bradyrhizobium oligotrophicum]|uniref:FRG domain-containing protein n=1 Tax=Bradyrhizobium TaxID=374 RepID=UPI003EBAE9B5
MIEGIHCTWEEFKAEAAQLRQAAPSFSPMLFRGQSNASWDLETTLERSGHGETVSEYYHLILRIKAEAEVATNNKWADLPFIPEIDVLARDYDEFSRALSNLPHYAYMAYLRHHSFPSPLLDWSNSPYVAAYFAFRTETGPEQEVAIFAYTERTGSLKISSSEHPQIHRLGPYVNAHKRHFSQQSEYTVCVHFLNGRWTFVQHSNVFDSSPEGREQDVLKKFVIKATERKAVLRELSDYNLNAYTLFGSEEGLMESLSNREEIRD